MKKCYLKGSEWRIWDLHIHTPASFNWKGQKFQESPKDAVNFPLVDEMIRALNEAEPEVFCFMDYWNFDGWLALKNRLKMDDAPKLEKVVFPGVELRVAAPMKQRLNTHVLFSDKVSEQELIDFLAELEVSIPGKENQKLSKNALISSARNATDKKLTHHGKNVAQVKSDSSYALSAGYEIAELTAESYQNAMKKIDPNKAVGYLAFDTHGGLNEIDRNENFSFFFKLFKFSPIFETRDEKLISSFNGTETENNKDFFNAFQESIDFTPRLAVSGSDAHRFKGDGNNDSEPPRVYRRGFSLSLPV